MSSWTIDVAFWTIINVLFEKTDTFIDEKSVKTCKWSVKIIINEIINKFQNLQNYISWDIKILFIIVFDLLY